MPKYYDILGLSPGATEEQIKQAYRDMVKVWHPDRFAHDPKLQKKAQEKLKEINHAYEQLMKGQTGSSQEYTKSGNDRQGGDSGHGNKTEESRSEANYSSKGFGFNLERFSLSQKICFWVGMVLAVLIYVADKNSLNISVGLAFLTAALVYLMKHNAIRVAINWIIALSFLAALFAVGNSFYSEQQASQQTANNSDWEVVPDEPQVPVRAPYLGVSQISPVSPVSTADLLKQYNSLRNPSASNDMSNVSTSELMNRYNNLRRGTLTSSSMANTISPKPFNVYTDASSWSPDNHYFLSGMMGDFGDIMAKDKYRANPHSGTTCIQISYTNKATQGARWAGMYWMNPANNWGTQVGGYDLRGYQKLTFWARGEKGGEKIMEFKIGGITGQYADSDVAGVGPVILTTQWQQFYIDLRGKDLSSISGGFCWATNLDANPEGCTFYLDDIRYE